MLDLIPNYEPPNQSLWQGRNDSLPGERFFQHIECIDIRSELLDKKEPQQIILGFCSDEGIRRNQGRTGAKSGPDSIREQLGRLACHSNKPFIDIGNIVCVDEQLESAQEQFAALLDYCHQQGHKTIAFGGGHEIAWAHYRGLVRQYPKIGIINFDAHFDLRPVQNGQGTSGTPFWQIKQYSQDNNLPFDYCCLGIQSVANTKSLFDCAHDYKVAYLTVEAIHEESFAWQTAFLDDFMLRHDYLYLTICLDVFAECFAPGVSAPQAVGLTPWHALPLLKYIAQTGKVVSLDIAELSPTLDQGQKTARLAASMLGTLLNFNQGMWTNRERGRN